MWFVYVLKSINHPFLYVGMTHDLERRMASHNSGMNQSTKHYAPFSLETYIAVKTEKKAKELEKYFKAGSGKAVSKNGFSLLMNRLAILCLAKPDEAGDGMCVGERSLGPVAQLDRASDF